MQDYLDNGLMYTMRRQMAQTLSDMELMEIMMMLKDHYKILSSENIAKLHESVIDLDTASEIIGLVTLEMQTALKPFQEEWHERHKN